MWHVAGPMRLNRFLAASGLGSRRSCEELILAGRVTINGQICQNLATEVSESDFVKVGSKRVLPEKHLYVLLHKPKGFLCTAADTHERRTIFELIPTHWPRLFHVGRLDFDSEGLLILTNDGDLGLRLTHPRFKIEKEYEVLLESAYNAVESTPKLLRGVSIEGGRAKAESVRQIGPNTIRIVLRQGLKRQIRLMLYKLGYEVKRLIRVRIGPIRMGQLRTGEWRPLTAEEVAMLRKEPPAPAKVRAVNTGGEVSEEARSGPKPKRAGKEQKARKDAGSRRPKDDRPRGRSRRPGGSARPGINGRRSAASAPKAGRRP